MKIWVAYLDCNHMVFCDGKTPIDVLLFCRICGNLGLVEEVKCVEVENE